MIEVDWITNIPTPYRNFLHERMAEIFPRHGLHFRIAYMAWTESDRHWRFDASDLHYEHRVYAGLHPRIGGGDAHFNPGLLFSSWRRPADVLVVGGYAPPTAVLAPFVSRAPLRVLYTESHAQSTRHADGVIAQMRRTLMGRYHAYIVPGAPQRRFVEAHVSGTTDADYIRLPNLIDGAAFGAPVDALRAQRDEIRDAFGLPRNVRLGLCPARLEAQKGLVPFAEVFAPEHGVAVAVVGEGSEREALRARTQASGAPLHLLGQQDQAAMQRLYAAADFFLLPSLRDPSPLSPIEACAAGLPLLVSRRIGNFDDVLDEGRNGWAFDPERPSEIREALEAVGEASVPELASMGEASRQVYRERFDADACVEALALDLLRCHALRLERGSASSP